MGADVWVFVTESEDGGSLPHYHAFWNNFFHQENILVGLSGLEVHNAIQASHPGVITPTKIDHQAMTPFFDWMPTECICKTFECTTQFMQMPSSTYLHKQHQSANPAANIFQCGESDATDTIFFFDMPAVDGGQTTAQLFAGCHSKLALIHPLSDTGKNELFGAFQDRVHWH